VGGYPGISEKVNASTERKTRKEGAGEEGETCKVTTLFLGEQMTKLKKLDRLLGPVEKGDHGLLIKGW